MADNITVHVLGGDSQIASGVSTLAELKASLGLTAYSGSINGKLATDSESLSTYDVVTFTPSSKGGM